MSLESLSCAGLDHHRAGIELRERMSVGAGELEEVLADLTAADAFAGAVVLSTCNRTEIYCSGGQLAIAALQRLAARQGVTAAELAACSYQFRGGAVLEHLFRVAASLESMVVGEYQIMQQVKYAYEQARLYRSTDSLLNRVFQRALAVGKEVRTRTGIGRHKLSTASIAVDLARQIHGDLQRAHLLLVGAGEMAELSLQHFVEAGVRQITLVNRNAQRAVDLAASLVAHCPQPVVVRQWADLEQALHDSDIVLSSTSAPMPIMHSAQVKAAMSHKRGPLMLIDLAVPRDIDASVAELDDVYVFNIDHLESVVAQNRQLRQDEVDDAVAVVQVAARLAVQEVDSRLDDLRSQIVGHFGGLVEAEVLRLQTKSATAAIDQEVRYSLDRLAKKCQHVFLAYLRAQPNDPQAARMIREMLDLE